MLQDLLIPVTLLGGLGLLFGIGLSFVSKKFEVKVDERISRVREVLPGANCGACGETGCDQFAEAVVEGRCKVNGCPVGGSSTAQKVGEILGVQALDVAPVTARVNCAGSFDVSQSKFKYGGIEDCNAAVSLFGGPMSCTYGCVGMGSCVKVCAFGAIVVENGVARVIEPNCTACGKCLKACPKNIIDLVPKTLEYTVSCSSLDKGPIVKKNCSVGCIGCGKCTKVCPHQAITLNGALAKINPEKCQNCGECERVCPTKSILHFRCEYLNNK